jgi:hypothetical protein
VSGWVPMPAATWAIVAESLPLPWADEAAAFDLRWQHDQTGGVQSRSKLAARWGWTPDEVRTLLRHPERWWDPMKGPAPTCRDELTQRPPGLTRRDPTVPRREQSNAENIAALTSADPTTPRADPTTPHARELDPPSPAPPPSPGEEQHVGLATDEPTVLDGPSLAYLQAAVYFGEVVHRQIGRRPSKGPDRSSKVGQRLYAAVKKDPEAVLDAMKFAAESQIDRAVKLREYAGLTVETVLRHVEEYAELWRQYGDRPPPTARGSPAMNGRRFGHAGDGVLEEMWRERNQAREVYDGDG